MEEAGTATRHTASELDNAQASTRAMGNAAEAAQKSVEKLSGGFTVFKGVMSNMVSGALREGAQLLKDFVGDGITLASNLQEVDNVVSTAFGSATQDIKAFADNAATQFGLSSLAAQSYAGKLGAAFNAMGLEDESAEMSKTLTGLSGDLSSFWNMTADESYGKVFAGVVSGESEGLKSMGVIMTDATLQAFALTQGITKKISAMTVDEKVMLRYKFVLNATSQAQGDFAKTADSTANQMRIASLQAENATAAIGNKLVPTINTVISKFNLWMQGDYGKRIIAKTAEEAGQFAEGSLTLLGTTLGWVIEHLDTIKGAVEAIGIGFLSAKVTGFVVTMANLVRTVAAASKGMGLLNMAMAANPAMVIGVAVAALTAGLIALASNYQTLDDKLKNLKLNVPQTSVDAVTDGINAGITAADKTHEITITVNADTASLQEQLEGFLDADSAGGEKVTRKEYKAISKYVTDMVQPDIDTAKKTMEAQKADFQEAC